MLYHSITNKEEDKSVNRLCDKCSYQNDCYDEDRCPFLIMDEGQNNASDGRSVKNFDYIKDLDFNDLVAVLAKGLNAPALEIASWLASDAE